MINDLTTLETLVGIDSPTGYTANATKYIHKLLKGYGCKPEFTNKQAVKCSMGVAPRLAIAAHTDTLGAIVSAVETNGTLRISQLGGWPWNSFEGEYVRIITHDEKIISGTLLLDNPSSHANKNVGKVERTAANMHVRLDEEVENEKDVKKLGVDVGDIVCFEPRYRQLKSGYIKSRFMDNKAGCYVLFEVARRLKAKKKNVPVELFFSNYEEVGHGGTCGYAKTIEELLVIDMGVLGHQIQGRETAVSVCAKDSSGPYDYDMRKNLVDLARKKKINHRVDVYPYYGSDGSAALRAGNDFRVALIGPGVAASHGVERTHVNGIENTILLTLAYIEKYFAS